MSNRHLLLAVAGLGVLSALLLLMLWWREGTNARLIEEQKDRHASLRAEFEKTSAELRAEIRESRDELRRAKTTLEQTRSSLGQTNQSLLKTQNELTQARQTLTAYKAKPWLNQPGNQEPWKRSLDALGERVGALEKKPSPKEQE